MTWLFRLMERLRLLFLRRGAGTRLDAELQYHVERQIEENRAAGMPAGEAREAALRAFGNLALVRDRARATWEGDTLEGLLRELRFAWRGLRRTPGFTAVATAVMALGIGANVSLFTVVHRVVLTPLPFSDPGRLVMLYESQLHAEDTPGHNLVAGGVYESWKKESQSFVSLAVVRESRVMLSGTGGQLAEKLNSGEFSWEMLPTLGVQPTLGRNFLQAEDNAAANGTVLLSWQLWKRRFGGDAAILNRTIYVDARPVTVIGVMPAWFTFPDATTQLWMPVHEERPEVQMRSLSQHMLKVVGRLKPGVSESQAVAVVSLISQRLHSANLSDPFVYKSAAGRPLLDALVGDMTRPLYVLLGATGCLLLIACLNVANLLVARAATRRRDVAVRAALGGGWVRPVRERLLEGLMLAALGGALGVGLAEGALVWLVRSRPEMSRVETVRLDATSAGFALALVVGCAVIAGLISVWGTSAKNVLSGLQESSRAVSGDGGRTRLRRVLVGVEVSLTVVLLIGAGLLMKSYARLRGEDLGCVTSNVLKMHIGIPDARYAPGAARVKFFDELLERTRALPGVTGASFVDAVPGQGRLGEETFTIVEHPPLAQGKGLAALGRVADPQYFETMGIPLISGRSLDAAKRLEKADEVVVGRLFAEQFFPGEEPLGKHLMVKGKRLEIVGVVGSTRYAVGENPRPMMYTSRTAGEETVGEIVIRARHDVAKYALPVQRIVAAMDADLAVSDVLTMEQMVGKSTISESFNATLLAGFAGLSLMLAAAGLFGVMSYMAAQRTREMGIRMALGAQREQVLRLMLADGIRPALVGLAIGLAAGVEAARLLRSLLYETRALDAGVFVEVSLVLMGVAALACLLPAWRASRMDAVQALRTE